MIEKTTENAQPIIKKRLSHFRCEFFEEIQDIFEYHRRGAAGTARVDLPLHYSQHSLTSWRLKNLMD
jgi:hypothetical protein